jgi:hypothetical protein
MGESLKKFWGVYHERLKPPPSYGHLPHFQRTKMGEERNNIWNVFTAFIKKQLFPFPQT